MRSSEVMQSASLNWRRASSCQTGECIEVAAHGGVVAVRSSAHPDAGCIYFNPKEYGSFLAAVKGSWHVPICWPELKLAKQTASVLVL
jgi:hypothetical protein